jgi:hypothetical protein
MALFSRGATQFGCTKYILNNAMIEFQTAPQDILYVRMAMFSRQTMEFGCTH